MFGYPLETVYLTILIVIGCCTVLYLFFADVADVSVEAVPFLDPAVILSFLTFTSASAYMLERFTNLSSAITFLIAILIAFFFTAIVYFFLLIPLRSAETSIAYTDASLEGQVGKVIVPIPIDGYGEMIIESVNGIISKRAASFHNEEIPYDASVLIIEMRDGTAYVTVYEN